MLHRLLTALILSTGLATAQDRAPAELPPPPSPNPPVVVPTAKVERLDETHFQIGEIKFESATREIRFPAAVNMTEGLLEYAIVHASGKLHEALLVTRISATHLNLALTLLHYQASPELYPLPNDKDGLTNQFPEVDQATQAAARVQVKITWDEAGKTRTVPLNEWIQHATNGSAMPETLWVYGGSEVSDGKLVAEATGDIMAIFTAKSALFNYPGKGHDDDTVWLPFPKRVPAVGTKVTVIIAPNPELKAVSKP